MNKVVNRKAILVAFSLLFIVGLIAITSFVNAGLNPAYWRSSQFVSDMIYTISLALIGIVCGYMEGDNYYRMNVKGLFMLTYNNFFASKKKVEGIADKFSDWNKELFKRESYAKIIRYLKNENGIKQAELLLQLDRKDIEKLDEPQILEIGGEKRYVNSLSPEQKKAILNVFNGHIKVKYVHDSYFLNAYSKNSTKSMYEQAGEQERKKRQKFLFLMTIRVIFTILIGMVMTALTKDLVNGDKAQAWIKMLSRYFTLFSAFSWGIFIAGDMIKDECLFLDYKIQTLEQFYLEVEVNKTFVAKTDEEKVREKIEKLFKGVDEIE